MVSGNSFTKFMLIVCGIVLVTAAFSGCTDTDTSPSTQLSGAPTGTDASSYGSEIKLYADEDSVSLNKKSGKDFFDGGFDLNQLKDVEKIRLQSGGHEYIYKLIQKSETDSGSVNGLAYENTNPAPGEDLFDSIIMFQDLNDDGIIDALLIPADFDRNGELDTQMVFGVGGGPEGDHTDWGYSVNNI